MREDQYGAPVPWRFESAITSPDGIEVRVTIAVPPTALWSASGERASTRDAAPPIAQIAAADAMNAITQAQNEVPF